MESKECSIPQFYVRQNIYTNILRNSNGNFVHVYHPLGYIYILPVFPGIDRLRVDNIDIALYVSHFCSKLLLKIASFYSGKNITGYDATCCPAC